MGGGWNNRPGSQWRREPCEPMDDETKQLLRFVLVVAFMAVFGFFGLTNFAVRRWEEPVFVCRDPALNSDSGVSDEMPVEAYQDTLCEWRKAVFTDGKD